MVQLTIAHSTSLTSFYLQENLFYDFNGCLFHPNVDFPIKHTPFYGLCFYGVPHQLWLPIFTTFSHLILPTRFHFLSVTYHYHLRHNSPDTHAIYGIRMPPQHLKPTRIHNNTISKFILRHHYDKETSAFR